MTPTAEGPAIDAERFSSVLIVGAGLIGTSVALALARAGVAVSVRDVDAVHAAVAASRVAAQLGGRTGDDDGSGAEPDLVVVATPPDALAEAIAAALDTHRRAVVTDVGSVKARPLTDLRVAGTADLERYVGGHPMAGSERSGPLASSADLFDGRTWAVTPHQASTPESISVVEALVDACGAVAVRLTPDQHDAAVARTSHLPHLMAALTAGSLVGASAEQLNLSGQGLRDVTRIAAGDPRLWQQIIGANAAAVADLLADVRSRLDDLLVALAAGGGAGLNAVLADGVSGALAVPGKHGGPALELALVSVGVPDRPGVLAQLFDVVGEIGVNIEDVRIDHDPARPAGLVELAVAATAAPGLAQSLQERGWAVHR